MTGAGTGGSQDRVDAAETVAEIAAALREDPIVVQTALGNGRTAEVHAGLTELAGELDFPVYVALVRRPTDDLATDRPNEDLARKLHAQLDEPGLYVVQTDTSIMAAIGYDVPLDDQTLGYDSFAVRDELQSRLSDFLDDVRDDDANSDVHVSSAGWAAVELTLAGGGAPDDEELFDLVTGEPWLAGTQVEPLFADDARSEPLTDFVAGLTAAVITLVVAWRLLRAAAAWRGRQQDARAALTRQRDTRRDIARRAVARLERDLARADTSVETWAAAQDRLRAARSLTDSPDVLDLLGAEVLARQGIALLQDPASPYRPCFFDPRHGAAEDTVPIGRATVPACAACTARARDGAAPRALEVPTRGRLRPYYEGRSVWARTGFGALDDTTASRVLERGRR